MTFTPRNWLNRGESPGSARTPLDAEGQEDQEVRVAAYTDAMIAALGIDVRHFGDETALSDHTAMFEDARDWSKAHGYPPIIVPRRANGEPWLISNWADDRSADTAQPDTGAPYGYVGVAIRGYGHGVEIQQIDSATGPLLRWSGKTGANAGTSHNNKITGHQLCSGLYLRNGAGGGATNHAIEIRSAVDVSVGPNLKVEGFAGSGIKLIRDYFMPSGIEEYLYNFHPQDVKIIGCSRYGIESSQTAWGGTGTGTGAAAISGTFDHVDVTACTLGGFLLNPAQLEMYGCRAIANGGPGLETFRNPNQDSENFDLALHGCRFEGNSTAGGYELKIEGPMSGSVFEGITIIASTGAHLIGWGLAAAGAGSYSHRPKIVGGYYVGKSTQAGQKFLVLGSDCRSLTVIDPRVSFATFNGSPTTIDSLITDGGATTCVWDTASFAPHADGWIEMRREITAPSSGSSGVRIFTGDNGAGKTTFGVRFPTGAAVILATEA